MLHTSNIGSCFSEILYYISIVSLLFSNSSQAVEFTFDLADGAEDCFYEDVKRNTTVYFEYQVSSGGMLDVDVFLKDPTGKVIYEEKKGRFNSHQFVAQLTGSYAACFSNKFSTFSHKLIYIDFQVGEEPSLPGIDEHATVLTQMESSALSVHKSLNDILDAQTHHRLREAQGQKRAQLLNKRVMWWSLMETGTIIVIGIGQILILRNFFADRKPSQQMRYNRL